MADQSVTETAIEGTKLVGSGGIGMAVLAIAQRFFKKQDVDNEREAKALEGVLAELKAINVNISVVSSKVDVLTERTSTMRSDIDKLELGEKDIRDRLSKLEGQFAHFIEQVAK